MNEGTKLPGTAHDRLHPLHRRLIDKIARPVISGIVLAALVYLAYKYKVGSVLRNANVPLLVLATALYMLAQIFAAVRWHTLLRQSGFHPKFRAVLRANLIGLFVSNFMPGVAGGDLVRPIVLFGPATVHKPQLYASVVFERICGIGAVVILAATGAVWFGITRGNWAFLLVSGLIFIGILLILLFAYAARHARMDGDSMVGRYLQHFRDGSRHLVQYASSPRIVLAATSFSLIFQLLYILMLWCLLYSLGQSVPMLSLLVAAPLSWLAAMTPISLNGLGVREGTLVVLLVGLGVSQTQVTGAALLALVPLFLVSMIGAVLSMRIFRGEQPHA